MYCDRCGSPLAADARFCGSCGKAVYAGATPQPTLQQGQTPPPVSGSVPGYAQAYDGRVHRHVQTLALLWCINGFLRLAEVFSLYVLGRTLWPWFGHAWGGRLPFGFAWVPAFSWLWALPFFAFFALLHLLLAWSLYERKPWARILGLVVGFLALVRFPLGTALGIYTIWVLLPESSGREYERLAHSAA